MGIFSKIFGSNKLELTDNTQNSSMDKKSDNTDNTTDKNQEPSPFLVDDEKEDIKKD